MNKDELLNKLKLLDEEVSMILPLAEKIKMTIVGGSALIMQGYSTRVTMDIDLIDVYSPVLIPIMEKHDINCRSNAFCDCLAENYIDRINKINIETKAIDFYTLSLEDIVIMKLFSDREKDLKDIRDSGVIDKLDWVKLDEIISSGEADISFNENRYKWFLKKYNDYVKECKK